jgi:hypothetical protein
MCTFQTFRFMQIPTDTCAKAMQNYAIEITAGYVNTVTVKSV